jgi:hypothetical protein
LHSADPGDTGANELSGNGYARTTTNLTFTNSGSNPTVAGLQASRSFPAATGAWATATHAGIWTAATGGNFKCGAALDTPITCASGNTVVFAVGAINVSMD